MTDLRIKIGCVTFTPHGWDVTYAWAAIELIQYGFVMTNWKDRTVWDLCRSGF
jgi:hypothetical protein